MTVAFAFPNSQWPLWLALGAGIVALLWLALRQLERRRAGRLFRFVEAKLAPRLLVGYNESVRRPLFWLTLFGAVFLLLALAQPRWGQSWVPTARGSRDILVLLDTSESMNAQNPVPSRLARAKVKIQTMLEEMPADRFGLVAFSGGAAVQVPLTLDHAYFQTVLDVVTTDTLSEEGSDVAAAMNEALRMFSEDAEESGVRDPGSRAVLLISDGEQTSGDALVAAQQIAEFATVYVMGIGDPDGAQVTFPATMYNYAGGARSSEPHLSRLDEETLVQVARGGNGVYVRSTPNNADVETLVAEMELMSSRAVTDDIRFSMVNRYRWPLAVAFLCFAAEGVWLALMPMLRRWRSRRATAAAAMLPAVAGLSPSAQADALSRGVENAEAFLRSGQADKALEVFRELQVDHPDAPSVQFGIGCAQLLLGENALALGQTEQATAAVGEARGVFQAIEGNTEGRVQAEARYNKGNALVNLAELTAPEQAQQKVAHLKQAIEAYEQALETAPGHPGARQNLDHARYKLKQVLQNMPEEEKQDQQDQQQQPPPKVFSLFNRAGTDIPGADVRVDPNAPEIVQLLPPAQNPGTSQP